jgi:NarL family two-component system response regulator LiaR
VSETAEEPVRVALKNDYEIVVRGLAHMFEPYRPRVQLVELNAGRPVAHRVDIVLYDTFAQVQGHQAEIRELMADDHADKVVLYSWNTQQELVAAALDRGASGYLSKALSASELVAALERIHAGDVVVEAAPAPDTVPGDWPGRDAGLSAREAEVLALITQGLSNDLIARRTYLSANSVKSYIRSAYRKVGVTSRSQAVLWGVRNGFLPDVTRIPGPDAEPQRTP